MGPVNLHQKKKNVILCSEKKGHSPQTQLYCSEAQSWLRGGRAQLVASSELGPQSLSSHYH